VTGGIEAWQILAAVLGTGTVTTVVNWLLNRRKLSADTVKVIDEAAGNAVKRAEEDNTRLRREVQEVRAEYEELRDEHEILWGKARSLDRDNAMLTDAIRDQIDHSRKLAVETRRLGGKVPDPPELPISLVGTNTSPIQRQRPALSGPVD
jgi:uncharacterized protein YlxW (UPF0749 family)